MKLLKEKDILPAHQQSVITQMDNQDSVMSEPMEDTHVIVNGVLVSKREKLNESKESFRQSRSSRGQDVKLPSKF